MRDCRLVVHMNPNYHENKNKPYFWCITVNTDVLSNAGFGWAVTPEQAFIDGSSYLNRII